MEINKENIASLLSIVNAKPTKDLGQNFLVEPTICEKIVEECQIDEADSVLEIGPGLGSLTHYLINKTDKLTCVDIDHNMIMILNDVYKDSNVCFIEQDILKHNVRNYQIIVGNLPYNITTELVLNLLINGKSCKEYVLMIQAEAFNRFFDTAGKDYGPASILVHLTGEIKKLLVVKPGSFYPAPHCNSLVFKIKVKSGINRERIFNIYKMSKQLFLNRRKTIYNNLCKYCGKEKANRVLANLGIEPNKRPEELSVQIFEQIYDLLK